MNFLNVMWIAPIIALLACPWMVAASPVSIERGDEHSKLESADWRIRRESFYALLRTSAVGGDVLENPGPAAAALRQRERHLPILKLLAVENAFQQEIRSGFVRTGKLAPNGYYDYSANLLRAVCAVDDPRTIPLLLPSIGSGSMVAETLARYGEKAAPSLLRILDGDNLEMATGANYAEQFRGGVYQILILMLDKYAGHTPEPTRDRIKKRLLAFAEEQDPIAKQTAMVGLAGQGGDEAEKAIRSYLERTNFDEGIPSDAELKRTAAKCLEMIHRHSESTRRK